MSGQATGRVSITLDGDLIRSRTGASLQTGGVVREALTTDQGTIFYREDITPAQVTATVVHLGDTDVQGLRSLRDFTCKFETDTGVAWSISNAFVADVGELSNGEFQLTIQGNPANRTAAI